MSRSSAWAAQQTRQRAVQILHEYPESTLAANARRIGISRMHLYRLAVQFPDVRAAYKGSIWFKEMVAEEYAFEAAWGRPRPHKHVYAAVQQVLRCQYYLRQWEERERQPVVIFTFAPPQVFK